MVVKKYLNRQNSRNLVILILSFIRYSQRSISSAKMNSLHISFCLTINRGMSFSTEGGSLKGSSTHYFGIEAVKIEAENYM